MLRLIFILASSFILSGFGEGLKAPVIIQSKKFEANRLLDVMTYSGAVKVEFDNYILVTDKMEVSTYKKNGKLTLNRANFPNRITITKNDFSEIVILPNAEMHAEKGEITSSGEIYVQRGNDLFETKSIIIDVGGCKKITPLMN